MLEGKIMAAVGYVQVKRDEDMCILKCKICPEHKVRAKYYNVIMNIDEKHNNITKLFCEDCVAATGIISL